MALDNLFEVLLTPWPVQYHHCYPFVLLFIQGILQKNVLNACNSYIIYVFSNEHSECSAAAKMHILKNVGVVSTSEFFSEDVHVFYHGPDVFYISC